VVPGQRHCEKFTLAAKMSGVGLELFIRDNSIRMQNCMWQCLHESSRMNETNLLR
jgi:hypothetical protein